MRFKLLFAVILIVSTNLVWAQFPDIETELDRKVKSFLEENAKSWKDMNVPLSDGKILYDIIIENNYKSAVEIGTSTGHSAIWIAWALSKTGGKLITIEIDKNRYLQARANFKQSGLVDYIDSRLGNAHEIAPALTGKYDFVFSDADKYWYKNYFTDMEPKIVIGGCFTAHNVAQRTGGVREFLNYIESLDSYKTTVNRESRSGISISYKIK
ncbi:MAG: class I SAM-dependent methyltransferase [Bacteroidales bacterium]|jgi:predicted O-methyltransferase YrrM|nr:class I SAM-dependent methyltransferase [Bacteroidales bacterium]